MQIYKNKYINKYIKYANIKINLLIFKILNFK